MKTPSRIGIFFLALAVSLFLATFLRAYSPVSMGAAGNVQPDKWLRMTTRLLSPQNLRIMFSTVNGTPINLYFLTSQGLQEWKETGTLNPIISIENLSSTINTYEIPSRDFYTLLAYNPTNATEGIQVDLTLYGFEKDLILAITIITIIGIALPITNFALKRFQKHNI
jgi:hypothetical protein